MLPALTIALTAVAVAALLVGERRGAHAIRWVSKPLASTGFVSLALERGALDHPFGRAVLAALALSWLGDVLLVPQGTGRAFYAGVLAFLVAHAAFIAAFFTRGVAAPPVLAAALLTVPLGLVVGRFFVRRAPPALRAAIAGYAAILSAMLTCAVGAYFAHPSPALLAAAVAFYASDLSVALDRFVAPSFTHRAWGIPLYYAAQLLFAWAVGR